MLSSPSGLTTLQLIVEWMAASVTASPAPLVPESSVASAASYLASAVAAPVPVPEGLQDELPDAASAEPGCLEDFFLGIFW